MTLFKGGIRALLKDTPLCRDRSAKASRRAVGALLVCVLTAAVYSSEKAHAFSITSTIDFVAPPPSSIYRADRGILEDALARDGNPSVCGSQKPNPGLAGPGERLYDEYGFVALEDGCVTVTLSNAGDDVLFSAAYDVRGLNRFNPSAHYLADAGSSPTATNRNRSFSFSVVAGDVFYVAVHAAHAASGFGLTYTLDVDGVRLEPDFALKTILNVLEPLPGPEYYSSTTFQTGSLDFVGGPSTCDAPKANPGLATTSGSRLADVFQFTPVSSGCATIVLAYWDTIPSPIVIYDENGFNPADPSENYLADSGFSAKNKVRSMSVRLRAGRPITIVVHQVTPAIGVSTYNLNITGVTLTWPITITTTLDNAAAPPSALYATSTGTQERHLHPNDSISYCGTLKAHPGRSGDPGPRRFDAYELTAPRSGCVEVALTVAQETRLFAATYNEQGFVPEKPRLNYRADPGSFAKSPTDERVWSFDVTEGVPYTVVAHEMEPGVAVGHEYRLTIRSIVYAFLGAPFFEDGFETGDLRQWSSSTR